MRKRLRTVVKTKIGQHLLLNEFVLQWYSRRADWRGRRPTARVQLYRYSSAVLVVICAAYTAVLVVTSQSRLISLGWELLARNRTFKINHRSMYFPIKICWVLFPPGISIVTIWYMYCQKSTPVILR